MTTKFEMHEIMPKQLKERYEEVNKYDEYGFGKAFDRLRFGSDGGNEWGATAEFYQDGDVHVAISIDLDNINLRQEDIQAMQVDISNKMNEIVANIKNRNVV